MSGTPSNILIGACLVSVNAADIGYTKGGTQVRYEPDFLDVMADQVNGVVRKARSLERMYIKTTMLEMTLAHLRQAFMMPVANLSGSTLTLGYNGSCWADELVIALTGESPGCGTRTFTFSRCISFSKKEYNMKRDEETAFDVEFEVLKNASGVFGTVVDS